MADIFTKEDVRKLLNNKYVLFVGDSNVKDFYKDTVQLLVSNRLCQTKMLIRKPGENRMASFMGDKVISLPEKDTAGRDYFVIREFKEKQIHLRYLFITRLYGKKMIEELQQIESGKLPTPSVIIINSCVWDITRWGPNREEVYKSDMAKLFTHFNKILPKDTLVIWTTTLPVNPLRVKGGFLIHQLDFMKHSLRFMILEANQFAHQMCSVFGIDVLDLHYHMRHEIHWRTSDGLHWEPPALRHIVNLLLTHISLAFEEPLPNRVSSTYKDSAIKRASEETSMNEQLNVCFAQSTIETIKDAVKYSARNENVSGGRTIKNAKRRLLNRNNATSNTKTKQEKINASESCQNKGSRVKTDKRDENELLNSQVANVPHSSKNKNVFKLLGEQFGASKSTSEMKDNSRNMNNKIKTGTSDYPVETHASIGNNYSLNTNQSSRTPNNLLRPSIGPPLYHNQGSLNAPLFPQQTYPRFPNAQTASYQRGNTPFYFNPYNSNSFSNEISQINFNVLGRIQNYIKRNEQGPPQWFNFLQNRNYKQ